MLIMDIDDAMMHETSRAFSEGIASSCTFRQSPINNGSLPSGRVAIEHSVDTARRLRLSCFSLQKMLPNLCNRKHRSKTNFFLIRLAL